MHREAAHSPTGRRRRLDLSIERYAELRGGHAHAFHGVHFVVKFLFVFVLFEADRGNAVGLKDENEEVLEGEKVGEKRPNVKDDDGNETHGEERTVLQRERDENRPDFRAKELRRTTAEKELHAAVAAFLPCGGFRTRWTPQGRLQRVQGVDRAMVVRGPSKNARRRVRCCKGKVVLDRKERVLLPEFISSSCISSPCVGGAGLVKGAVSERVSCIDDDWPVRRESRFRRLVANGRVIDDEAERRRSFEISCRG